MVFKGLLSDKTILLAHLCQMTNLPATYSGAPRFIYTVGPYKILREGDLECTDPDPAIITALADFGIIEKTSAHPDKHIIRVPIIGDGTRTGQTLVNVINILYGKGSLLNIAAKPGFHISPILQSTLAKERLVSLDQFHDVLYRLYSISTDAPGLGRTVTGGGLLSGIEISGSVLSFPGFGDDLDEAHKAAWTDFAEALVRAASCSSHLTARKADISNPKYTMRVWLNALDLKGEKYKGTRATIMSHYEGIGSFKTAEQHEAFNRKRRVLKEAERNSRFVVLN